VGFQIIQTETNSHCVLTDNERDMKTNYIHNDEQAQFTAFIMNFDGSACEKLNICPIN